MVKVWLFVLYFIPYIFYLVQVQCYIDTKKIFEVAKKQVSDFSFDDPNINNNKFVRLFINRPEYPILVDKPGKIKIKAASYYRRTMYYCRNGRNSEGEEKFEWTSEYRSDLKQMGIQPIKSLFLKGDVYFNDIKIDKSIFVKANCVAPFDIQNTKIPADSVFSDFEVYDKNILYSYYGGFHKYDRTGDRKIIFRSFAPESFTVLGFYSNNSITPYLINDVDVSNVIEGNKSAEMVLKPKLEPLKIEMVMRACIFFIFYFVFCIYITPKAKSNAITVFITLFNISYRSFQLKTYPIRPVSVILFWIFYFYVIYQKREEIFVS